MQQYFLAALRPFYRGRLIRKQALRLVRLAVVVGFTHLMWLDQGFAQASRQIASVAAPSNDFRPSTQRGNRLLNLTNPFQNPNAALNTTLFEDLDHTLTLDLNPQVPFDPNLQWPSPPRTLFRPTAGRLETSEFTFGIAGFIPKLPLPVSTSMGAQANFKYEELVETGLNIWMPKNQTRPFEVHPRSGLQALRRGIQAIGACEMRITIQREHGQQINASVAGNGWNGRDSRYVQNSITYLSHFFQIQSDVDIASYIDECESWYNQTIQKAAREALMPFIAEQEKRLSNRGSCQLNSSQLEGRRSPFGDSQCQAWFEANVPRHLRQQTVARCELQPESGEAACVAKSRVEGQSCPLYQTARGLSEFRLSFDDAIATRRGFGTSFECDRAAGLSCQPQPSSGLQRGPASVGSAAAHAPLMATCIRVP